MFVCMKDGGKEKIEEKAWNERKEKKEMEEKNAKEEKYK